MGKVVTTIPDEIRLAKDRTCLEIRWRDGTSRRIDAVVLRAQCRSASAIRGEFDRSAPSATAGLTITRVEPVGSYAVNLAFSDGEARGIYPWSLLRSLGQ
jgi:DUF971 family protein